MLLLDTRTDDPELHQKTEERQVISAVLWEDFECEPVGSNVDLVTKCARIMMGRPWKGLPTMEETQKDLKIENN